MPNIVALDRLKSQLLTSGIQQKNQALFQIINQLIDFLRQTIDQTTTAINAIPPPAPPGSLTDIGNIRTTLMAGLMLGTDLGISDDLPDGPIGNFTGFTEAGDFYEEASWTPVLGGSGGTTGQTYAVQHGFYVRVMRLVGANFNIKLTNKGTITANLEIQGFPYNFENTTDRYYPVSFGYWANLAATVAIFTGQGNLGAKSASLYGDTGGASSLTNLTTAAINNNSEIRGFALYRTLDK